MRWWVESTKRFVISELYRTLSYFSCYNYWMYFFFYFSGIPIGNMSSAIGLKICWISKETKKYKSIFKKKKHHKIGLFAKCKLSNIEVLIFKALIDSNISYDKFVLIYNVLKQYDKMKEEIKNLNI